jgi:hypothetical protein
LPTRSAILSRAVARRCTKVESLSLVAGAILSSHY